MISVYSADFIALRMISMASGSTLGDSPEGGGARLLALFLSGEGLDPGGDAVGIIGSQQSTHEHHRLGGVVGRQG
jgi:hypothetical protein